MVAYLIASIDVTDPEDYVNYASKTVALAKAAGGKFLAKGGDQEFIEGDGASRHVIIEFPSREAAIVWYNSDAYRAILPIAMRASERTMVVVDGF